MLHNELTLIPHPAKIIAKTEETKSNFTIVLESRLNPQPGQFIQVGILGVGEAPISIASHSSTSVMLNISKVGRVTTALSNLKAGDSVHVRGPYGKGFPVPHVKGKDLILIGGGCGVAPLRGVLDYVKKYRADYKDVRLYFGFRSPEDLLFTREMEQWKKDYNVTVTVDKVNTGTCYDLRIGFVTKALEEDNVSFDNTAVFICGPPIMMKNSVAVLKNKGFSDEQIFVSLERLMYCAFGVCCHCMIRDKFVCKDGPVFRWDEIKDIPSD